MIDLCVYDCETKTNGTFKDPYSTMGFLCGVVYSYFRDRYFVFDNAPELVSALNGNICVSFNGVDFDTRLLLGNNRKFRIENPYFRIVSRETIWREYDLFLIAKASHFRCGLLDAAKKRSPGGMSLDALCQITLNRSKIKINMKRATPSELIEYCLNDVRITRQLFEEIIKNGFVRSPKVKKVSIPSKFRTTISSVFNNLSH
jgi:hypothetical protein